MSRKTLQSPWAVYLPITTGCLGRRCGRVRRASAEQKKSPESSRWTEVESRELPRNRNRVRKAPLLSPRTVLLIFYELYGSWRNWREVRWEYGTKPQNHVRVFFLIKFLKIFYGLLRFFRFLDFFKYVGGFLMIP